MADFTVGKYLAARFEQIGLKHYFMVPGDYNLVLLDELLTNENLEQIGCCNELNAAYAAEGYARVNGAGRPRLRAIPGLCAPLQNYQQRLG